MVTKIVLAGPPGSGKSTLARLIARMGKRDVREIHRIDDLALGGRRLYQDWPPLLVWDNVEPMTIEILLAIGRCSEDVIVTTIDPCDDIEVPDSIQVFSLARIPEGRRVPVGVY